MITLEQADKECRERAQEILIAYEYPPLPDEDYSDGPTLYEPLTILNPENLRIAGTARIDSFVKLECGDGMVIGEYCHIASFSHIGIGGGVTILEDETSFASGSAVISGSNVPGVDRGCSAIGPGILIKKYATVIRERAVLFAHAVVLPGVEVGVNAVIAAGAVVNRNVPAFEIWGGVPARKIGEVPRE